MPRNAIKKVMSQTTVGKPARNGKIAPLSAAASRDLRIGFLIHDVSRMRRSLFDQFMKPFGVTRSQWWVIAQLSREDGMMQTELATLLDIGKVTLGGLIDRLEASGWIRRQSDPGDRRVKRIFLTSESVDVLRKMGAVERILNQHILKNFNAEERDELAELLARLKSNIATALSSSAETGQASDET